MRKRKTYHNYWEFPIDIQENYLNLRHQVSYLQAGYYLRNEKYVDEWLRLIFYTDVQRMGLNISLEALKKARLI